MNDDEKSQLDQEDRVDVRQLWPFGIRIGYRFTPYMSKMQITDGYNNERSDPRSKSLGEDIRVVRDCRTTNRTYDRDNPTMSRRM